MTATEALALQGDVTPERLAQAFKAFEKASETMTRQYESLQRRVAELDLELEAKNQELRQSLREREAFGRYLESLLESLTNGVIAVTPDGRISTINDAAEAMLDGSREALLGRALAEAIPALADWREAVATAEATGNGAREIVLQPEADAALADEDEAEPRVVEVQFRSARALPGEPPHCLAVMRDVTELRRLERMANLQNRLTAMGEMAMSVAHEIRNPLGSIELFASALRRELEGEDEQLRLAGFISQGVRSIDNIVGNILTFARPVTPSLEPIEPSALLDKVLAYARFHMEQKNIALARRNRAGATRCLGDVELLQQVFLNLLLNATQAMDEGGRLTLETRATRDRAIFVVADNGSGIAPEAQEKIFDPFFTTKRRGTGLGLSICHNIIQAHNGDIEVESEPGEGTRFTIRLPKA